MQHNISTPEEWRDIPGWEGYYQVSDQGRVRSVDRVVHGVDGREINRKGKIIKLRARDERHLKAGLSRAGEQKKFYVHRLVVEAFHGAIPQGFVVRHLNGDPKDNRAGNLAIGTHSENYFDAVKHGTRRNSQESKCLRGHDYSDRSLASWDSRNQEEACKACSQAHSFLQSHPSLRKFFQEISDSFYKNLTERAPIK